MFIYIFRHGESVDNRHHVFSGWRNSGLSDKGKIDAAELAELLKDKEFNLVFTADLKRNLDTVKEILKFHPNAQIIIDKRLRERRYGNLQGKAHLEIMRKDITTYLIYHRSYNVSPPGGESIRQVEKRVLPFCHELVERMKREKVNAAVCAGNNSMRVIRRFFEKSTIEEMMKIENPYDNFFTYTID